ncbi:hypothetical protein [Shewanella sp.]|uniref:hypothetical protein n=1 Tax=Shewanella sp. TaxID=50422 RepID=UPI003A986435
MEQLTDALMAQFAKLAQQHALDNATVLHIDTVQSYFYQTTTSQCVTLPVGYQLIASRFFQHTPPTPDDVEHGINYIEDQIERAIPTLGSIHQLVTQQDFLIQLAQLAGVNPAAHMQLPRPQLERIFGYYAEISQGRPPLASESDISREFYAKLLIIREYMHHLKVLNLTLVSMEPL